MRKRRNSNYNGIQTRGPFSPTAYNKYIDGGIVAIILDGKIVRIIDIVTGIIVYADDTTILCETENDLKEAIKVFEAYCKKIGIQINEKKTKWMKMGEKKT